MNNNNSDFKRPNFKRKLVAEINVVPYIDVMLVLLIVFMVATPLITQGVEVDLPEASSNLIDNQEDEPLVISIKSDKTLYINTGGEPDKARSLSDIQLTVEKVVKQNPKIPVMVWGDKDVAYGEVVSLMSALQQVGANKVGLVTEPPVL